MNSLTQIQGFSSFRLRTAPRSPFLGYSILEVLIVVGVIGVLGGIAAMAIGKSFEKTRVAKLESDVRMINQATDVYLASGGSFAGVESPQEVLDRMKTRISADQQRRHAGVITESAIDVRLEAVMLDTPEGKTKKKEKKVPRALWNAGENRFEIADKGKGGVKEFRINEDLDPGEESLADQARLSTMLYASADDSWVWDFQDAPVSDRMGPTVVNTGTVISAIPGGTTPVSPLAPPIFSLPGGSYPAGDFDLPLELYNPNPGGISTIYYQIDGGLQLEYTGAITVPKNATVAAVSVSTSPSYFDSPSRDNSYIAKYEPFLSPVIAASKPFFPAEDDTTVQITITHENDPAAGDPQVYYTLNESDPVLYSAPFTVDRATYEADALAIAAWVESADPTYETSPHDDEFLKVQIHRPVVNVASKNASFKFMEVTITDPNPPGMGTLRYRVIDNALDLSAAVPFITFTGMFQLRDTDYPDGFTIEAYVEATDTSKYVDSLITTDGGIFFGVPLKERTIFVLDASSSMSGSKFETVRQRMLEFIDKFTGNNYIAIVEFDAGARTMLNWNKMNAAGKALATAAVNDLETGSGTHYQMAFEQVDSILESIVLSGQKMPQEVVFLTDGGPSSSGEDRTVRDQTISAYEAAGGNYYPPSISGSTYKAAWIRAQKIRENYGIPLSTIAVDTGTSSSAYNLLNVMATENNGAGPAGWISSVSF